MLNPETIIIHCATEEEVVKLLNTVPIDKSFEEAYKGWKTYNKNICYGLIHGKICWYCDLHDLAIQDMKVISFNEYNHMKERGKELLMETSINECLKYYEEELKEGNYTYHGFSGMLPDCHIGQINKVVADISDDGICSDIVIYTVGAAMKKDHYYGGGVDVTDPVVEFLKGRLEWDEMIQEICNLLEES